MAVRVLVVDDDDVFRQTLAQLLVVAGHAEVVGTASDGDAAVELYRELAPDVVLMDVVMPVCDGIEATTRIVALDPRARIVALTDGYDDRALEQCLAAGARGCLRKGSDTIGLASLVVALGAVAEGLK